MCYFPPCSLKCTQSHHESLSMYVAFDLHSLHRTSLCEPAKNDQICLVESVSEWVDLKSLYSRSQDGIYISIRDEMSPFRSPALPSLPPLPLSLHNVFLSLHPLPPSLYLSPYLVLLPTFPLTCRSLLPPLPSPSLPVDVRAAREQMHIGGVTYPTLPLQDVPARASSAFGQHSAACSPTGSFSGSLPPPGLVPPQPHSSYYSMPAPQHPFYTRVRRQHNTAADRQLTAPEPSSEHIHLVYGRVPKFCSTYFSTP